MRRTACLLKIHRITVARKLKFLARQARDEHARRLSALRNLPSFQFDELETIEHSKCKPLSVLMAVVPKTRKILGIDVAVMPCKGPLAERARRIYGTRPDRRDDAFSRLFGQLQPVMTPSPVLISDSNPRYPSRVARFFPQACHITVLGRRGSLGGQGELKRISFDPLFSLNHTFAMLRANVNRLFRKTWCTTKKANALADHLALYAHYHNSVLT